MLVGICELELNLLESFSLKDKRSIIKSLIERIRHRFNVSISEIDLNDDWKRSIIGFSFVSNKRRHIDKTISSVLEFIEKDSRVEIIWENIEII